MNRFFIFLVSTLFLVGCTTVRTAQEVAHHDEAGNELALFSSSPPGGLPTGWEPMILVRTKKPTLYELVTENQKSVLYARADSASSGLMRRVDIDPQQHPWLQWQWKVKELIKSADNRQRAREDSPVRIILGFDGDKDSLPFSDQILFETARVLTGHDFPYATLMYIWENKAPAGTVIRSTHSSRIRMLVVESGDDGIGQWRNFTRNIVEDFEKVYGEKPGKLIGVGVLTDTDNTGEVTEAWYGDIRLLRERGVANVHTVLNE